MDSCVNLGSLYETGDGVTLDAKEAERLYIKGCDGGQAHGCQYVGVMYRDAKDVAHAAAYFKKGCNLGDATSCSELAQLGPGP
jgi:TPR repeat protein